MSAKNERKSSSDKPLGALPSWDGVANKLWLGDQLLLVLKQPAPFRAAIMAAFQAQGWDSQHATVTLPMSAGDSDADHKARLVDAIGNLNRDLPAKTIHFGGDGTGRGVRWYYGSVKRRKKKKK
jgi:hypothetical protein